MTKTLDGSPLTLELGATYRGVLHVGYPRFLVSKDDVRQKFGELGFVNVTTWLEPGELPPDWPGDERPAPPSSGWWAFAQGTWGKPSAAVERPDAVHAVWLHAAANGAAVPTWKAPPLGADPYRNAVSALLTLIGIDILGSLAEGLADELGLPK